MKKLFIALCLTVLYFGATAQTATNKNNFSGGFGFTEYNGSLGSSWLVFNEEWYGVLRLSYSRYINPSFDAHIFVTTGDYGHCQDDNPDTSIIRFRTRLTVIAATLKYKFANGYIFKEDAKFSPFVYAGAAMDFARDIWHTRIGANNGNYLTFNWGLGLTYNVTDRIQFTYNLGFGCFTTDAITFDYNPHGTKDMYMQNSLSIGYNF
jgi:hypothetical protein